MKVRNMALCALFAALLAVCAWLAIPVGDTAFTMQTFGVLLTLGLLGGRWGSVSILLYLLLGLVGLPVFSGFQGGFGVLLGVPNFLSSLFLLKALASVPGVIAFPSYSVATILVVAMAGLLFFREKLARKQIIGAVLICIALVLLNL